MSRPYDIYGCWYNNSYVISSEHEWLNHTISCNKFWINKVDLTLDSDPGLACMRQLYRTHNAGGCTVRQVLVGPRGRSEELHRFAWCRCPGAPCMTTAAASTVATRTP